MMSSSFASERSRDRYDAVVVGSGPNGLAAAITLAEAGAQVLVIEAAKTIGGGMRSTELTLPGFLHDHCSAIHALGVASPFFRRAPLHEHGLKWLHPGVPAAHPLPDGTAAIGAVSLDETCASLGRDGDAYRRLMGYLVEHGDKILKQNLGPFRPPRHPLVMARFGLPAIRSAWGLCRGRFRGELAAGLFAGMAAHSILPLEKRLTAAVGLMLLITVHRDGWPVADGGSQSIADAMARYLQSLGGEIIVDSPVRSLADVPDSQAVLFDLSPRLVSRIAGDALPAGFARQLDRFRHGPGIFKVDWALDGPIPWANEACSRAGTVHLGGTLDEVARSERAAWSTAVDDQPFVLVAQQSLFDSTRAPAGKHTGWAYCHVPAGGREDMTERIEAQMERFAPGFRRLILARHCASPADFEHYNANYIGGDIAGGVMDAWQLFTRPTVRWSPYTTPNRRLYICSASTPPGAGVHGMCGWHAAQAALRRVLQ